MNDHTPGLPVIPLMAEPVRPPAPSLDATPPEGTGTAGSLPLAPGTAAQLSLPTSAPVPLPPRPGAPAPVPDQPRTAMDLGFDDIPALAPVSVTGHVPLAPVAPTGPMPTPGPVLPAAAQEPGVTEIDDLDDERIPIDDLLIHMVENGGSDLHLSVGSPPVIRVHGDMQRVPGYKPLTARTLMQTMYSIMNGKQRHRYEENLELDFAYTVPGQARFRVNVMRQRGAVGAVMRTIPWDILSLDALNLPAVLGTLADLPRGLVLVTGPTGSGKSTTLAAIIDRANRTRRGHIITIEDPVEFLHQHRGCVVNQREVGDDTHSFAAALKHVLRQDPDIILVGELRDLETISVALTAAETGHLVFATLHTQSAQDTITRIVDVFPPGQQQQIRTQLAASLQGIVCQTLCKTADGTGRQAAVEILTALPSIRAMIRDDKLQQVQGALQAGAKHGMNTLNQDLAKHVLSGRISYETALDKCSDRHDLTELVGGEEAALRAGRVAQSRARGAVAGAYSPVSAP